MQPNSSQSPLENPQNKEPEQNHTIIQKKQMPLWFKIAIALSVLALIAVTAGILFTESWVDVVDHQLDALRHKDVEKAYTAYTSKEFQENTSLEQFRYFVEAHPIFFDNQFAHFTKRSLQDHIGTLVGHLTSSDHVNFPIKYKLIKEDGKWKILSIRFLKTRQDKLKETEAQAQVPSPLFP